RLYQRGLQYGLRLLSQYHPALLHAPSLSLETLTLHLRQLDREAVPALLWTSFCWGSFLNLERTALETATALPLFQALLTRLLELDETYFYGLPHLLQAVHYARFSAALGGDPSHAQSHFDAAYASSQGTCYLCPCWKPSTTLCRCKIGHSSSSVCSKCSMRLRPSSRSKACSTR